MMLAFICKFGLFRALAFKSMFGWRERWRKMGNDLLGCREKRLGRKEEMEG